eukprot:scaffold26579_cov57-Phaeocystis_antarctica.AAC.2
MSCLASALGPLRGRRVVRCRPPSLHDGPVWNRRPAPGLEQLDSLSVELVWNMHCRGRTDTPTLPLADKVVTPGPLQYGVPYLRNR